MVGPPSWLLSLAPSRIRSTAPRVAGLRRPASPHDARRRHGTYRSVIARGRTSVSGRANGHQHGPTPAADGTDPSLGRARHYGGSGADDSGLAAVAGRP